MSSDKFCLKWNDFEANISGAFRELREDKDFFDVTLACDDEQINAHKVILSACSPFFKNILRRNPHQHPLLYMKGVSYSNLQAVLNFMYHGEVNVAQDELNTFLAVAEDLRVKGLTQNQGSGPKQSSKPQPEPFKPAKSEPKRSVIPSSSSSRPLIPPPAHMTVDDDIQEVVPVKQEPPASAQAEYHDPSQQQLQQFDQSGEMTGYEEGYDDYGQFDDSAIVEGAAGQDVAKGASFNEYIYKMPITGIFKCKMCGKINRDKSNIRKHVESIHFPGTYLYTCKHCGEVLSTKSMLHNHIAMKHKSEK